MGMGDGKVYMDKKWSTDQAHWISHGVDIKALRSRERERMVWVNANRVLPVAHYNPWAILLIEPIGYAHLSKHQENYTFNNNFRNSLESEKSCPTFAKRQAQSPKPILQKAQDFHLHSQPKEKVWPTTGKERQWMVWPTTLMAMKSFSIQVDCLINFHKLMKI